MNRGNARISLERASPVTMSIATLVVAMYGRRTRCGVSATNVRTCERTNGRTNGWTDEWTRMSASKHSRTNRMARGFSGQLRGCSSSLVRHGPLTDPRSPLWFRVASPPQRRVAAQRERQSGCARSRAFFDPAASTAATPLLVALRFDSESTACVWYYACV